MKLSKNIVLTYSTAMLTIGSIGQLESILSEWNQDKMRTIVESSIFKIISFILGFFPQIPFGDSFKFDTIYKSAYFNVPVDDLYMRYSPHCYFIILWILLLVGTLQYLKKDKITILTFVLSLSFFSYFTNLVFVIVNYFLNVRLVYDNFTGLNLYHNIEDLETLYLLRWTIINSFYLTFLYFIVKFLLAKKTFKTENNKFKEASLEKRILGRIIEMILIVIYGWKLSIYFLLMIILSKNQDFLIEYQKISVILYNSFATFFYYLIHELSFNTTPAKILLETGILNNDYKKPSFNNIIQRTLSRLIPFESIAFILGYKLHDIISKTGVFEMEDRKLQ
eukprot:GDKK01051569.1.p1 GENE.GDKK01051569.1~~GDKK01051569.1.p1  ORF type:complete len:336 (+),score=-6.07 GDKK01051569.1:75-1082(+)